MSQEKVTINIPRPIANKLKERIKGTAFDSLSSYVTYILCQVLANLESKKETGLTNEQKEEIDKNLKALGYK